MARSQITGALAKVRKACSTLPDRNSLPPRVQREEAEAETEQLREQATSLMTMRLNLEPNMVIALSDLSPDFDELAIRNN